MTTTTRRAPVPAGLPDDGGTAVCLLGGPWLLRGGRRTEVPEGSRRLLVFAALHGGVVDRRHVAGTLWPDGGDERAAGNLRSALWRLRGAGLDVLTVDKGSLQLSPGVRVDARLLCAWAGRVLEGTARPDDWRVPDGDLRALTLLPGWTEEWVVLPRERIRQRLVHAVEAVSSHLVAVGRPAEAVAAAARVVAMDPLRESSHRALVRAHLAQGDVAAARHAYDACRDALRDGAGLEPSPHLTGLVLSAECGRAVEAPTRCHGCPATADEQARAAGGGPARVPLMRDSPA